MIRKPTGGLVGVWLCVLCVLAAAPPPASAQHQAGPLAPPVNGPRAVDPSWHALVHARLHPAPGRVVEDATIVLRNGVVTSVGAGAHPPEGARVWDCTGLDVYAGLIDPWVEVDAPTPTPDSPGAHWNPKVTPQRRALDGDGVDDATAAALRKLGFAAAGISPRGGIFAGRGAVTSLADRRARAEQSGPAVRRLAYREDAFHALAFETFHGRAEANQVRYPQAQSGAIALIRQTLMDASWMRSRLDHGLSTTPVLAGQAAAANCLLTLTGDGADLPLIFDVGDELQVLRAAKIGAEFDRPVIVVGSGTEFRRLAAIRDAGVRLILPLDFPPAPRVASIGEAEATELRDLMTWEQAPTNPRRMVGAGLTVALTTAKLKRRDDFWPSLRKAIRYGLSEDDALAMLTATPAAMLGVSDTLGAVKPGAAADLLVTDGGLFEKDRVIRDVWIDGVRHEITPAPPADLSGKWDVTTEPPASAPITLVIRHDPKSGRPPSITIRKNDATSKAANVSLIDDRISLTFDHTPFGESGVFTNTGVIRREADGTLVIRFDGVRASGARFRWTARRTGPADEQGEPAQEQKETKPDQRADQAKPDGGADADSEGSDESEAADVPETYGYPFGPYAMDAVPPQRTVAFTNATIWTCGPKGILEHAWLIIEDGKVKAVGTGPMDVHTEREPEVIDCSGRCITPGIIDCHSHTGLFSGGVNESGQAVSAEVRMGDITNPDTISWYRQLAGGVTCANQLHGSANPIGGQSQTVKNRWGCIAPDDMHFKGATPGIKFALGENVKQSNWGDRFTTRYPQTRMGVEMLIRDRFTEARAYAEAMAKADADGEAVERPRRDLELEALAEVLSGKRWIACHSYRQDEILMLCRVADDFGFRIGTFQHVLEGYKVADEIRTHAVGASCFSDWWAYKVEVQDAIPENGAIMYERGVNVSFNSDSDELARRLNVEAGKAVKYGGVPPVDALKFVTLNPAIQLGIDKRVGSLEAGKDADLVVWSGPPMSDFSTADSTWIDGREYFSVERDKALRAVNEAERQRIIQKILGKGAHKPKPDKDEKKGDEPGDRPPAPPATTDVMFQRGNCGCGAGGAR